jgi:hypothetical protein
MATKLASILGGIVDKIGEPVEGKGEPPPEFENPMFYDEALY